MPFIRGFIYYFIIYFSMIFHGTFALIFAYIVPFNTRFKIITSWNVMSLWMLRVICKVNSDIIGRENIPQDTRFVILCNHESTWETVVLQPIFAPLSTVLKKELLKIPFFGWCLASLKPIAIDRSNPRDAMRAVLSKGVQRINEDMNVLVFPEGTRNPEKKGTKYARSGAAIAIDAGVPILPIAHNAVKCWPNAAISKYPGTITLSIGKPILTEGRTSKEVTAEAQAWIEAERKRIETL